MKPRLHMLFVITALAAVLAGCAPAAPQPIEAPVLPTQEIAALPATGAPAEPSPATGGLPAATPTARPGLEASDPAIVTLAAGSPTLVEFFAFW